MRRRGHLDFAGAVFPRSGSGLRYGGESLPPDPATAATHREAMFGTLVAGPALMLAGAKMLGPVAVAQAVGTGIYGLGLWSVVNGLVRLTVHK